MLVLLSSCSSSNKSSDYLNDSVELTALEVFAYPNYKASRTKKIDLIHTDLKVNFNWEKQYLIGEATLTIQPYFYAVDEVILDAKGQQINKIELVTASGNKTLKYNYVNDVLTITLDKEYSKTEEIKIYIDYVAKPEERKLRKGKAVTSDKGLYFINPLGTDTTTPQQIWTQGETEANSIWFPTIDSPNERCTHQISITIEDKFKTLSNGDLLSSVKDGKGMRTDVWAQKKPIAPYLFMMAISEYAVVKDSFNGMDVNYYVDKDYEPYAREIFENTTEMIPFYSELLGYDYPWSKYSQVIAHEYVSGAMENVGAVIFGDFVQQTHQEMIDGKNESIVAHELFHHWFGDVVTCESWSNLPLNESFATYGEYLWFEHKYGKMKADEGLNEELTAYLFEVQKQGAKNLIRFEYGVPDDMFDSHSYAKGGRILHMLRTYVGDEAFFMALKNYLHENEFTSVEIHQLRMAFEKVTGEDLNWFFNQWFMGKGHPELEITYNYDADNLVQNVLVKQVQDIQEYGIFRLPVDIDIYYNGVKETFQVVLDSLEQTFSFNVNSQPDLVNFDAKKVLVCEKTENHTMKEMAFMFDNSSLFMDKREAILFASEEKSQLDLVHNLFIKAIKDDYAGIRELAIANYVNIAENDSLELKNLLISTLKNDQNSMVRVEAVYSLYDLYLPSEELLDVFDNQIKIDSSYSVISQLLKGVSINDIDKGLKYAEKLSEIDNIDVRLSVAEIYSVTGLSQYYEHFNLLYSDIKGYDVLQFTKLYIDYLLNVDDVETHQKGLAILEKEAVNQLAWYARYYAVSGLVNLKEYYESKSAVNTENLDEEKAKGYKNLAMRVTLKLEELSKEEKDSRVFMKR